MKRFLRHRRAAVDRVVGERPAGRRDAVGNGHRRTARHPARCRGDDCRFRSHQHGDFRRSRQVPLLESGAGILQGDDGVAGLQHHRAGERGGRGRRDRRPDGPDEGRHRRRNDHGHRRVADRRYQGNRHGDQLHRRRADEDSDLARPVRADAGGARRARRSRQHRRQRDRPAVELRLEGHAAAGRESGRSTASRSPTWPPTGASPTYFNYDNFDEIQVSDRRPTTSRSRPAASGSTSSSSAAPISSAAGARGYFDNDSMESVERAGRAARASASRRRRRITTSRSRTTASTSADRSCATRRGSTARTRSRTCSLVRRAGALVDRTQLKNPNVKVNWQATRQGHGQLPLLRRVQDQGRPQPRHAGHHCSTRRRRRSTRTTPTPTTRCTACGRSATTACSARTCSCRRSTPTTTPASFSIRWAAWTCRRAATS